MVKTTKIIPLLKSNARPEKLFKKNQKKSNRIEVNQAIDVIQLEPLSKSLKRKLIKNDEKRQQKKKEEKNPQLYQLLTLKPFAYPFVDRHSQQFQNEANSKTLYVFQASYVIWTGE